MEYYTPIKMHERDFCVLLWEDFPLCIDTRSKQGVEQYVNVPLCFASLAKYMIILVKEKEILEE